MLRRIMLVASLVATMGAMMLSTTVPALADDWNHSRDNSWNDSNNWNWNNHPFNNGFNDNGVFQSNEQQVQSGDSSQTFTVTGGGDNSNSCQGIQGISNTGNAANNTGVLQTTPFNNDGNNWNGHNWNGWNNWNNGNNGQVEVGNGDFTINPSSTTTCSQQVNQAATAS